MRVLLDTCVLIDFLQNREPFAKSAYEIMRLAAEDRFSIFITAKSSTDIYYLIHRCTHSNQESRDKLQRLLGIIGLLDTSADDVINALVSETADFEDAVMIETAFRTHMDCIVTRNQSDFKKSSVQIYSPEEFLNRIK